MHEKTKPKYSISKIAKNIEKEIEDLNFAPKPDKPTAENAKLLKQEITKELVKKKNNRWRSKPLHGKYPSLIGEPHVDLPNTNNWLNIGIIDSSARPSSIHAKLSKTHSWQRN